MMTQISKRDVRRDMKRVLANLDHRWVAKANAEVCALLVNVFRDLQSGGGVRRVLAWVPCFPGEIDLTPFIGAALQSAHVYLPCVNAGGMMTFVHVGDDWASRLVPGYRGIPQPQGGYGEALQIENAREIAVVTPGIAFDRSGRRLGRGGGYYDRFLADERMTDAVRIGVCWSMQLMSEIPVDDHDVSMDWICHERGVIEIAGREK